jgi:asparagine synthase (glutamine-hydrolysing)
MLFLDWQFTLADNDLRKVSQTCAVAGVDVAYPMLDDDLVDFSMGIPSEMKLPGKQLRDFYKKALRGWLPEATLNKSKQGFGLPFGVWMSTHRPLQEIAYDNILKLKSRGIFNSAFLENAIAMHRTGHAAYFGELIWILCVLELWMSSHLDENYVYTGKES